MQCPFEYFFWVRERRVYIVNVGCRQSSIRLNGGCYAWIIESGNFFIVNCKLFASHSLFVGLTGQTIMYCAVMGPARHTS